MVRSHFIIFLAHGTKINDFSKCILYTYIYIYMYVYTLMRTIVYRLCFQWIYNFNYVCYYYSDSHDFYARVSLYFLFYFTKQG